jgi:ElaA protein
VRIGAQAYLEKFYASFGFQTVSDIYLEDEIPHLIMLLPASDQ